MTHEIYADYKTANGADGCVQSVCAGPRGDSEWPTQINIPCALCKKTHGFVRGTTFLIRTPGQKKNFMANVERLGQQRILDV